jgi:hypothetical protein
VLGQLTRHLGAHAIGAAPHAHRQGIERAGARAGTEDANRIEKGSEGIGSHQHRNSKGMAWAVGVGSNERIHWISF